MADLKSFDRVAHLYDQTRGVPPEVESKIGDGKFLELETLTLCPVDLRLVDEKLLVPAERDWLNAYHKRVFKEIAPSLKGDVKAWLKEATRSI